VVEAVEPAARAAELGTPEMELAAAELLAAEPTGEPAPPAAVEEHVHMAGPDDMMDNPPAPTAAAAPGAATANAAVVAKAAAAAKVAVAPKAAAKAKAAGSRSRSGAGGRAGGRARGVRGRGG
jgi:hypothetical protein